jgi:hypothetical protein
LDFGEIKAKDLNMKMDRALLVKLDEGEMIAGVWDSCQICCVVRTFKKEIIHARFRAVRP